MVGTTLWTSPIWLLGTVQGKERCRNYPTGLYWLWPQSKLAPTKEGCMADSLHPAASHHLPLFITAPGETDVLMVVMGVILVLAVLMFGILFFRLHSLPERMAHKSHKIQMEIVAERCASGLRASHGCLLSGSGQRKNLPRMREVCAPVSNGNTNRRARQ